MPNTNRTDIILLIDRSGSMDRIKMAMEEGIDKFLSDQAESPAPCYVSVFKFDDTHEIIHDMVDIHTNPRVFIRPRGNTALIDSMYWAIKHMVARFATIPEPEKPGKIIFVCVTDGEDNASHLHTQRELKALVEERTTEDKWEFVYLGANQDAFKVSGGLGVGYASTMSYAATAAGVSAVTASLSASTTAYRSGVASHVVLNKEDKKDKTA